MATAITNKGNALLAKLTQGIDLEITSAKTGAGTVATSLLEEQTGVTSLKQEISIKSYSFPEPGTCALVLGLTNEGVSTGYTLMQIGIYAQDPDEGEILFSIWQADDAGVTIHSETVLPGYSAEWNYNIIFDQADSVTVNVDPTNTVSQAAMEAYVDREVISVVEDHTSDTSNPHNVTAAQIGLGNVDNTADSSKNVAHAVSAGEADKTKHGVTVYFNGGQTEGTDKFTFDGSASKDIDITPANIGLGNVNNTADNDKSVAYAVRSGEADKTKYAITVRLDGGRTEGSDQFTFDGSTSKAINITPDKLGLGNVDNTADSEKQVAHAVSAGEADKTKEMLTIRFSGGSLTGYSDYTFDGSEERLVPITPAMIGLGNVDNTADANKIVAMAMNATYAGSVLRGLFIRFNGGTTRGTNEFFFTGADEVDVDITPAGIGALSSDAITAGTTDLTAGTSALATGKVYLVYE